MKEKDIENLNHTTRMNTMLMNYHFARSTSH